MKRFFSLMLVALLLVSALPFAASAAGEKCPKCQSTNVQSYAGHGKEVAATCTTAGKECWICRNCTQNGNKDHYFLVDVPALGHDISTTVGKPATCTVTGIKTDKCLRDGCDYVKSHVIDALGHAMDAGTVTTPATCGDPGVRTYACANGCGYETTEEIPATGNHSYNAAGECTVCGGSDNLVRDSVAFRIDNVNGVTKLYTETFIDGRTITVPSAELIPNYEFKGWYENPNGSGDKLTTGSAWEHGDPTVWYAWYVYNPAKDGTSTITVTARCYIDGIGTSYRDVPVLTVDLPDNTNVFDWLTANRDTTILNSVYNKVDTTKYEWKDRYFYNHNGSEVLTAQTVFADGPKAILIKLDEKDNTTRANVQLYLHKSSTSADPFRILDMNGYTSGMNVTRDAAAKLVKEYYSYSSIGNLYTDANWNALQRGENAYGATSIAITDNGTYKIHVVVSNASTKSNSTADTTNPKTGDYIMIAVGTMVLAAAAVITLAEMKKRKMI